MSALLQWASVLFGTPVRRDLWLVVLWCWLIWALADEFEFFEWVHLWTREYEYLNLDEILVSLMALPLALSVFAFRRHTEMSREVVQRRLAEDAIRRLAHFDALTSLPNRALLEDRLAQLVARARRNQSKLAVLFIDLDGFKAINDRLGHAAGDTVLREIAWRIRHAIRDHDTAARLGGDEFIVLLDETASQQEIQGVAQRLIDCISEPLVLDGLEVQVSASIGISVFSGREQDDEEPLLRHADKAMYQAKAQGKNQFRFFDGSLTAAHP